MLELAKMSAESGEDVTIAFGASQREMSFVAKQKEILRGISVKPFPYSFPKRFSASSRLVEWLEESLLKFDVVHIHSVFSVTSIRTAEIASKNRVPYILRPAGSLDRFDLQKKRLVKYWFMSAVVKRMLENAKSIHCTSLKEKESLESFGAQTKVVVLPLPVSVPREKGSRERFRSAHGIGPSDFVWLFMSRIDYKKGLEVLLGAMGRIVHERPWTRLLIAGGSLDGYKAMVVSWIREKHLDANVTFVGFVEGNEKADVMAAADCFVLPSMNENFGVAVVESLASGLPVVISKNVYIWREVVARSGGVACEYSEESLVGAMLGVMNDHERLMTMRAQATKVAEAFSPDSLAPIYSQLYHDCVANKL